MTKPEDLWRDLCEKDDRTSPEEYPAADVMKLAENLFPLSWAKLWFSGPLNQLPRLQERVARALQQYGDDRGAAAIEQANKVHELHSHLVGHVEMDPESRAEWVMKQSLDGLHIGENNRGSTVDYLAGHFRQAMVDAGTAARIAAIEEALAKPGSQT